MNDIEKRRRALGLLQREVADAVGVNVCRIRKLEWGCHIKDEAAVVARVEAFFATKEA